MDQRLLDPEFVRFVREHRTTVVVFAGAGVSVDAGIPAADDLAPLIADAANLRDAGIESLNDFAKVCAAVTETLGTDVLKEVVAEVVLRLDAHPTPLLRSVVRAPTRIVVTSNYDDALEQSVRDVGLVARSLQPRMAAALGQPSEGEVFVVHIHGVATDPASIVVPGTPLEDLPRDEAFIVGLRGLLAPYTLVYLGYRFPPEDVYLRAELQWLADNFQDTSEHALLTPAHEYAPRASELDALRDANFRIFTFDASRSYDAVQQAALVVAPQSNVRTEEVTRRPDRERTPYFRVPLMVRDDPQLAPEEFQQRLDLARMGLGDLPFCEPAVVRESGRAVVTGEPGIGKTELLLTLGSESPEPNHLYLRLADAASQLLEPDVDRAFLRALANAAAIVAGTQKATAESMAQNAYVILLDAFDEVHPDQRAPLAARLQEIIDRWPQHAFVVTTRPIQERQLFPPSDWEQFRLIPDAGWGTEYLTETRGIPQAKLDELFAQFPRASELIAIPLYAALIGNRLALDEPLPHSALELITQVTVQDALGREAEREGLPAAGVYRYLKTLAVALEIRGRNAASVAELRELPGPEALGPEALREHLIQQALLRDLPDVAQFQAVSVQEALAAEALLETADPVATVRAVATAEVDGDPVLRRDIDHALDLLFEAAPHDLRAQVRELDALRWARTQPISITEAEAEETLRFLWEYFREARIWIDSDGTRELRDARAAVERIAAAFPAALIAMRSDLLNALESEEPTARGNAVFFLSQLTDDDDRVAWLEARLIDDNTVVQRWAAEAVRRHRVEELLEPVRDAYRNATDELAAEALGATLLALAPEDARGEAAVDLLSNPVGWSRLSYAVERLPLDDVLTLLEQGDLRRWEDKRLLDNVLEERPINEWSEADVERLARLLVGKVAAHHIDIKGRDAAERLATQFPEAALRGAASAVTNETLWIDLLFLGAVPRELLEAARRDDLEAPLTSLLEYLDQTPAVPAPEGRREEPQTVSLADWIESGVLDEKHCPTNNALIRQLVTEVDGLTESHRERLTSFAGAWWPVGPLADAAQTDGRNGESRVCLVAALAFQATLGLEVDEERWLEIFETDAIWFYRDASQWMAAQYPGEAVEGRVAAHIVSLADPYLISIALDSLPELTPSIAETVADAIARLPGDSGAFLMSRLREADQLDALRVVERDGLAEEVRLAARRELAAAGDIEAQRAELNTLEAAVEAGADFRMFSPDWLGATRIELLPEVERVLRAVAHRYAPSESDLGRTLTSVLERLADERAVRIYDELIADPEAQGGTFYWHQRESLIGEIARRDVLARLPEGLSGVVDALRDLGYSPEANSD